MHRHFMIAALLCSMSLAAQTMVFKDKSEIPATPQWDFLCENYALTGKATIQIAPSVKGGWLSISADANNPNFVIADVVYLYLDDQTVLVCTDKGLHTNDAGRMISWYQFSPVEMQKLKKTDIQSIRFSIRGKGDAFSSQTGNFTAVNRKSYFSIRQEKPATYPTAQDVAATLEKK